MKFLTFAAVSSLAVVLASAAESAGTESAGTGPTDIGGILDLLMNGLEDGDFEYDFATPGDITKWRDEVSSLLSQLQEEAQEIEEVFRAVREDKNVQDAEEVLDDACKKYEAAVDNVLGERFPQRSTVEISELVP